MIDFTNHVDFTIGGQFTIAGTAPAYTGYSSTISDTGEVGVKLYNSHRYDISGIRVWNINGTAFGAQSSAGGYQHMGRVHRNFASDSYRGFWWRDSAEYDILALNEAHNCVFGFVIDAGNLQLDACKATNCTIGISILGGTNNAHGLVNGFISHHNAFPLVCTNVTLGMAFNGCSFIAGLDDYASGVGTMPFTNSKGITMVGGQLSKVNITVDANSELTLTGMTFRGAVNVTVAAGGVFKSANPAVMPGATLTLNGAAWNGIA